MLMTELTPKQIRIKNSIVKILRDKRAVRRKKMILRSIIRDYEDVYAGLLEDESKLRQQDLEEFSKIDPQSFQEFIQK